MGHDIWAEGATPRAGRALGSSNCECHGFRRHDLDIGSWNTPASDVYYGQGNARATSADIVRSSACSPITARESISLCRQATRRSQTARRSVGAQTEKPWFNRARSLFIPSFWFAKPNRIELEKNVRRNLVKLSVDDISFDIGGSNEIAPSRGHPDCCGRLSKSDRSWPTSMGDR